jgi:sugar phosphate permease
MVSSDDVKTRRWVGWAVLASAFVLVNFHRVSTGVLAEHLARAFDTTGSELGLLHASFFYIYAPLQFVAGVLADQKGTRRVAGAGSFVMALGALWFATSGTYLSGFASRALVGLGGSVIYIATLRYCANWFRADEFATVTGLTLSASALGGLVATTPLAVAVADFGWRASLFAVGVAGLGVTAAVVLVVRDSPAQAGLASVADAADPPDLTFAEVLDNARVVLRERETWIMGAMLFFAIGTNFTVMGLWGVPYLVHAYDLSVRSASLYTLAGNAGLLFGSPVMGWLSDRLGRRTELIVAAGLLYTLAYGGIAIAGTPPLAYVGIAFFGVMFLLGGFLLSYTVVKERHAGETSGTATGAINAMGFFGGAVLPGVMGVALDVYWTGETVAGSRIYTLLGYRVAFAIATASGLVALGCALWLHRRT